MPNRMVTRCVTGVHKLWYRLSGGRIGGRFRKVPVLLLTTKGRKSGREWTTPLMYLKDDGRLVVIASFGGSDKHPTWYLNLRSEPRARVQVGGEVMSVTAETASPEEKARLWPLITDMYGGYEGYQRRTTRDIPVVILKPEGLPQQ